MRRIWIGALLISVLTVSGCIGREAELRRLWKAAEREGTVMAYIGFLAEQKYDEDVVIDPDFYDREGRTRAGKAVRAIRSLGREAAQASCGFETLDIALDQQVENVDVPLNVEGRLHDRFASLGVELVSLGEGEKTLHLQLRGAGEGKFYGVPGEFGQYRVTGGLLEVTGWFAHTPEISHSSSSVRLIPTESAWIDPNKLQDGPLPKAIPTRLVDAARLNDVVAHLLFDACGPAAAALVYLNNRPDGTARDNPLESRLARKGRGAFEFLLGASFSNSVYDTEIARFLLAAIATKQEFELITAARGNLRKPSAAK